MQFCEHRPFGDWQPRDDDETVDTRGERHGVAEIQNRRRIDQDKIGALFELGEERGERVRTDEFGWVGRERPDREHLGHSPG